MKILLDSLEHQLSHSQYELVKQMAKAGAVRSAKEKSRQTWTYLFKDESDLIELEISYGTNSIRKSNCSLCHYKTKGICIHALSCAFWHYKNIIIPKQKVEKQNNKNDINSKAILEILPKLNTEYLTQIINQAMQNDITVKAIAYLYSLPMDSSESIQQKYTTALSLIRRQVDNKIIGELKRKKQWTRILDSLYLLSLEMFKTNDTTDSFFASYSAYCHCLSEQQSNSKSLSTWSNQFLKKSYDLCVEVLRQISNPETISIIEEELLQSIISFRSKAVSGNTQLVNLYLSKFKSKAQISALMDKLFELAIQPASATENEQDNFKINILQLAIELNSTSEAKNLFMKLIQNQSISDSNWLHHFNQPQQLFNSSKAMELIRSSLDKLPESKFPIILADQLLKQLIVYHQLDQAFDVSLLAFSKTGKSTYFNFCIESNHADQTELKDITIQLFKKSKISLSNYIQFLNQLNELEMVKTIVFNENDLDFFILHGADLLETYEEDCLQFVKAKSIQHLDHYIGKAAYDYIEKIKSFLHQNRAKQMLQKYTEFIESIYSERIAIHQKMNV